MEEFYRAQARWEVRQELKAQEEAKEQAEQNEYAKSIFDAHNHNVTETRAKYEDFDESVTGTDTPWKDGSKSDVVASQAFQVAIFESGIGGEILYYYAKHPEELNKLGPLSPARVQMAVGRIIDKLEAQEEHVEEEEEEKVEKPALVKKLPPPFKPTGGSATKSSVPLDKMSMSDYKKARAAGRIS
jgi:hypothetical protein